MNPSPKQLLEDCSASGAGFPVRLRLTGNRLVDLNRFRCPPTLSFHLVLSVVLSLLLVGCVSSSGTKTPIKSGALSRIERLEVMVGVDKDFSVVVAGEKANGLDFFMAYVWMTGGLVGQTVAGAVHGSVSEPRKLQEDEQRAKNLRAGIAEINLQSLTQKALVDGLQSSHRFKAVIASPESTERSPTGTGILRVTIEDWGLYADKSSERSQQKVQIGFHALASLIGLDGKVEWERRDYLTGGVQRSFNEYGSSPSLLKNEIEETATRYCARVVNEIRYAP